MWDDHKIPQDNTVFGPGQGIRSAFVSRPRNTEINPINRFDHLSHKPVIDPLDRRPEKRTERISAVSRDENVPIADATGTVLQGQSRDSSEHLPLQADSG